MTPKIRIYEPNNSDSKQKTDSEQDIVTVNAPSEEITCVYDLSPLPPSCSCWEATAYCSLLYCRWVITVLCFLDCLGYYTFFQNWHRNMHLGHKIKYKCCGFLFVPLSTGFMLNLELFLDFMDRFQGFKWASTVLSAWPLATRTPVRVTSSSHPLCLDVLRTRWKTKTDRAIQAVEKPAGKHKKYWKYGIVIIF